MTHLEEAGENYWQHMWFAGRFGLVLILVGLCVLVHAIAPIFFEDTGSRAVRAMYKALEER